MKKIIKNLVLWAFNAEMEDFAEFRKQIEENERRLDKHVDYLQIIVKEIGLKFKWFDPIEAQEGYWTILQSKKKSKKK